MELKRYQKTALETLERFLLGLRNHGLKFGFMAETEKPYSSEMFGGIPFVCVKIPTGGGKTLVGCHAIEKIMDVAL
jgi:type III restriction enzyme